MNNKNTLSVYDVEDSCPLIHTDLRVYSFLLFQDKYSTKPTNRTISRQTGLSEKTVAASLVRLAEHGLLERRRVLELELSGQQYQWFRLKHGKKRDGHQAGWFLYWKSLIRSADSPLTVSAVSVYSYVRFKTEDGFSPTYGWSCEYIAKCIRLKPETVENSLTLLDNLGLVKFRAEPVFDLRLHRNLTQDQIGYFADRKTYEQFTPTNTGAVYFDDDTPKPAQVSVTKSEDIDIGVLERKYRFGETGIAPLLVSEYLEDHHHLNRMIDYDLEIKISKEARQHPDWPNDWKKIVDNIMEERKVCQN